MLTNFCVYSSHLPVVVEALLHTGRGPVLEMGVGHGSTPTMHWICEAQQRRLVSMEADVAWMAFAKDFITPTHDVQFLTDWDAAPLEQPWDVALIDHAPAARRRIDLLRVAPHARVVIVHDTEWRQDKHYGYKAHRTFDGFRFVRHTPWRCKTTILSNEIDVTRWAVC